jgi:hypothetical protein
MDGEVSDTTQHLSPGILGWLGVVLMVAAADGVAMRRGGRTMSDEFARHRGWGVFIAAGTMAHLAMHGLQATP